MGVLTRVSGPIAVTVALVLVPVLSRNAGSIGAVPVASAASGGATLAGEVFQPGAVMVTGGTGCQPVDIGNSTFEFTASGVASGPVPGTYTETGNFTIGLNALQAATVVYFQADFQIYNGTTRVASGTKYLASDQPLTSFGFCTFAQPNVDAMLDYTADVGGNQLTGQAEVMINPTAGSPTGFTFQETFESSTTISCYTTIDMPFNGQAIAPNTYIWMPAAIDLQGASSTSPVTISFTGQTLTLNVNGVIYPYNPPDATVTFDPAATSATTHSSNKTWSTVVPSYVGGKVFLTGVEIPVPTTGFPGGIKPVTWSGQISSLTHGVTVHWQWGAAVYPQSNFSPDYETLEVKPVDNPQASVYLNGDNAGTPEAFKQFVIDGARGGGGNN